MSPVWWAMCSALLIVALHPCNAAPKELKCTENDQSCKGNNDCCGGCCQNNRCVPYGDGCVAANNPCFFHVCPPTKHCYLQPVECVQANCKPVPACRSTDNDY